MFEQIILLGDNVEGIHLETSKRQKVLNDIAPPPTDRHRDQYKLMRKRYGRDWENRRDIYGQCNCYGLVFASRRTSIREDNEVDKFLNDDVYRKLRNGECAVEGDLVLYRVKANKKMLHIGQVVRVEYLAGDNSRRGQPVVRVLSKWNDSLGEDIHHIVQVPYDDVASEISIEIWTDRP